MLKNYLKTAFRYLWRNRVFTCLNLTGLAAGLATCLLILLYVLDEWQYDRYNVQRHRIYRIDNQMKLGNNEFDVAQAGPAMGPVFKRDFPQISQFVRFRNRGGFLVQKGQEHVREEKVIYVDSTVFDVFTLPMLYGKAQTALTAPYSVVITASMAQKYFNTTDAVGRTLLINNKTNYTITGVIKDVPRPSHFNYDFFVAMAELPQSRENSWISQNYNTYFLLKPGSNVNELQTQLRTAFERYAAPELKAVIDQSIDQFKKGGGHISCSLMPLTRIHLYSHKPGELAPNASIQTVGAFSAIALFILLIACINFMNLATASSANRAREVGVRKVLGSERKDLVLQFLTESFLICTLALILAIAITWLLMPFFNELALKDMSVGVLFNTRILLCMLLLLVTVSLLAGSYPAFYLSAFKPVAVLKGKLTKGFKRAWLRNALVVLQFTISIVLIAGTLIIYDQLDYIRNKDLGYKKEQLLIIKNTQVLKNQAATFRNELLKIAGVQNSTVSGFLPVNGSRSNDVFFKDASLDVRQSISMQQWGVDEHYIPTLQIQMIKGRNFFPAFATDSGGFIINETAAKQLGIDDPGNNTIYQIDDIQTKRISGHRIIGIMKDFNFNSLHEPVTPLALYLNRDAGSITLRIHTDNLPTLLQHIENKWRAFVPAQPFSYSFMDEDFQAQYLAEQRTGKIAFAFAVLAILVACVGLFGLVTFAAHQRVREIGIRKILGASIAGIISLLSKDLLKLVLLSIVLASPLAYWVMHGWLEQFAYRVTISWLIFVWAGLAGLLIAFITIGFQIARAALTNPVKSLRTE